MSLNSLHGLNSHVSVTTFTSYVIVYPEDQITMKEEGLKILK